MDGGCIFCQGESMKILGLVVEYNPFHNGHIFHLRQSKELVKPDYTVAVMSGNFVQRGEPSIIEKFARAGTAIKLGIDVVLELPVVYSLQDAGGFATGAIRTLEALGVTDIVFGSETGELSLLNEVSKILLAEPEEYRHRLHSHLKDGHSFPNARKYAIRDYVSGKDRELSFRVEEIGSSNNILGLEYLRAIREIDSKIRPHAIKRKGAAYSDDENRGSFSSATAIRKMLRLGDIESVKNAVPGEMFKTLLKEIRAGRGPILACDMESFFLPFLRLISRNDYSDFYGFVEGLDARFCECSKRGDLQTFLDCVKTKRFTLSRIRRLMYYPALKFTVDLIERSNRLGPQYIRLLAFNENGREYLSEIKKSIGLPIISTVSMWRKVLDEAKKKEMKIDENLFKEQLERDLLAVDFYSSFYSSPEKRSKGSDMLSRVIYERDS